MPIFFIVAGTILRLVPHLPNFAPIAAMALFGGVYLNKKYALIIPLLALFLGDLIIGFYNPFVMISVYGSFLIIGFLGLWLKKNKSVANIVGVSLLGSVLFFGVTNFVMWVIPHSLYQHNLQGLVQCYTMGLPFFRNTILGDLFYIGVMFTLMELVIKVTSTFKLKKEAHVFGFERVARKRF